MAKTKNIMELKTAGNLFRNKTEKRLQKEIKKNTQIREYLEG